MSAETRTDKELMAAYVDASDPGAFEALFGRYHEMVYSVCVRCLKQSADAEDAAIAAFLVLQKKAWSLRSRESLGGWLYLCAISVCRDASRAMRRRSAREKEVMMLEEVNSREPGDEFEEALPLIEAEIARLPEYQRNALVLQFYQGMNRKEIATRLGCSENTVGNWINRGLETLRARLSRTRRELGMEDLEGRLGRAGLILPVSYGLGVKFSALMSGKTTIGSIASLAEARMRSLLWTKVKSVAAIAAGAVVVGGTALAAAQLAGASTGDEKSAESSHKALTAAEKPPATLPAAQPEAKPPAPAPENLPEVVLDDSSPDWVVEPFAGNASAGQQVFFDGPALQVGGLGAPNPIVETPDGTVYFNTGAGLAKVAPDGTLRLVLRSVGKVEGPADEVASGRPVWNPKDNSLYLTGPNCIRRLYTKPDGTRWVEVVAGTPDKPGKDDGPAKTATLSFNPGSGQGVCDGFFATSKGTIYFSDGGIRKLENGAITTVTRAVPGFQAYDEEADTFYFPLAYSKPEGFFAKSFDPKTGNSAIVCGMLKPTWRKEGYPAGSVENRFNRNSDGPALTHASFNSNFHHCLWDPYHKALWVFGPDEERFRWLKDGWVRTVITKKQGQLVWCGVFGVGPKGQIYLTGASAPYGVWRARNTKEVKP
ncbi:MAG: hypothetical protein C0404_13515 [Verrucomicrobia bacterium]|nr:hypothetical protein [Verrucomicrobiota bacterium]